MKPFAKLFELSGIGQVLVQTMIHPDTDNPAIQVRVPDCEIGELTTMVSYPDEETRDNRFETFTEEAIRQIATELVHLGQNFSETFPEE